MRCIDIAKTRIGLAVLGLLAGCFNPGGAPPGTTRPGPGAATAPEAAPERARPAPEPAAARHGPGSSATQARADPARLPAPRSVRNWVDVRQQAAERLVAANPEGTYLGTVPEALLAIPVLEIELNGDGSVRRIVVLRAPRQAKDTVQIAMDAIHRAAPFGNVSRLPKPWRFVETFLFDDDRRFKPRTLVL